MVDETTCRAIDKLVDRVLREARLKEPPIRIDDLLSHLEIDRDFYNLEDPGFLRKMQHKIKVFGQKLINVAKKVRLSAVWLPNREKILIDSSLPPPKQKWASFHDVAHSLYPWQKIYFLGDTAETLDPDIQMRLEAEAHYGASALMFGGKLFTEEALDTIPQ
jgi:Zn-dependent peptidase ImmA (M78 family)